MKYKVGDKVRIIAKKYGHGFKIGSEHEVTALVNKNTVSEHYEVGGEEGWFCDDSELELVTKGCQS